MHRRSRRRELHLERAERRGTLHTVAHAAQRQASLDVHARGVAPASLPAAAASGGWSGDRGRPRGQQQRPRLLGRPPVLAAEILGGRPVIVRIEPQTLMFVDPDTRELLRVRPNRSRASRRCACRARAPPARHHDARNPSPRVVRPVEPAPKRRALGVELDVLAHSSLLSTRRNGPTVRAGSGRYKQRGVTPCACAGGLGLGLRFRPRVAPPRGRG